MKVTETDLPGCLVFEPRVFGDERGFFFESFNHDRLAEHGLSPAFVQGNVSSSRRGVLRGLHYQLAPRAQGKLVRVVQGAAFDVAVDIRKDSRTFGQWVGVELTADNQRQLWIPAGFAHGFVALEDNTHFLYKTTDTYSREHERSIRWDDPDIGVAWPLGGLMPVLAPKDAEAPLLSQADTF